MRTVFTFVFLAWSPVAFGAADLATMCHWSESPWNQGATLRLPGSDVPFATAGWGGEVTIEATLALDPWYRVRLHSALVGGGLAVGGDIDPNEDLLLSLIGDPLPLGPGAVLVPGARFSIGAATDGGVFVGPDKWSYETVEGAAVGVLPCERMTIHWQSAPDDQTMYRAIGFTGAEPQRVLPKGRALPLRLGPDGPVVGRFRPQKYSIPLRVAEERDGWSYVAYAGWMGTIWHGWVPSRRLKEPGDSFGSGLLGGMAEPDHREIPVRRCDAEVALHASVGAIDAEVGKVHPGTPFEVVSEQDGSWSITFPGGWITPVEGASLRIPADPEMCAEGTWTADVR